MYQIYFDLYNILYCISFKEVGELYVHQLLFTGVSDFADTNEVWVHSVDFQAKRL